MNAAINSAASIYLDANIIIYYMERDDELQQSVGQIIAKSVADGVSLFISEIGIAECLYGTYRPGREELSQKYIELFHEIALFSIIPIDGQRAMAAAKLGAEKGLKLVDAIHFVGAIETGSSVFLTNDARFKSSHQIEVVQLRHLLN